MIYPLRVQHSHWKHSLTLKTHFENLNLQIKDQNTKYSMNFCHLNLKLFGSDELKISLAKLKSMNCTLNNFYNKYFSF